MKCQLCKERNAAIKRPKNGQAICKEWFFYIFEEEVHYTIVSNNLFKKGEKVGIGASGGKDSTVLAHVLTTLNKRYDYGLSKNIKYFSRLNFHLLILHKPVLTIFFLINFLLLMIQCKLKL